MFNEIYGRLALFGKACKIAYKNIFIIILFVIFFLDILLTAYLTCTFGPHYSVNLHYLNLKMNEIIGGIWVISLGINAVICHFDFKVSGRRFDRIVEEGLKEPRPTQPTN